MSLEILPLDVWGYLYHFMDHRTRKNLSLVTRAMNWIIRKICYRAVITYPVSLNTFLENNAPGFGSHCPLDTNVEIDDLKVLKYVSQLFVNDFIFINEFFTINRLSSLTELNLKWCSSLMNSGLRQVCKLSQLRNLHFSTCRI